MPRHRHRRRLLRLLRLCDRRAATLPSSLQRCEIDWRCCCCAVEAKREEEYTYVDEIGWIRNFGLLLKIVEYLGYPESKMTLMPHILVHFLLSKLGQNEPLQTKK